MECVACVIMASTRNETEHWEVGTGGWKRFKELHDSNNEKAFPPCKI